jgi:hypothetical protein
MSSKKEIAAATGKEPLKRRRAPARVFTATQKAEAVLALWTERVKTAVVMRTLGVPYITLQQWQDRAMEGMMQALEPRTNLADGAALSPRLRTLLLKRTMAEGDPKLKTRLKRLQEVAQEPVMSSNP